MRWLFIIIMAMLVVIILSGCGSKESQVIYLPQKCKVDAVIEPQWSDESVGDRPGYLRAVLENSGKHKSYEYDLKAALNKCR